MVFGTMLLRQGWEYYMQRRIMRRNKGTRVMTKCGNVGDNVTGFSWDPTDMTSLNTS